MFLLLAAIALAAPRVAVVQSDQLDPYIGPVPEFLKAIGEDAYMVNIHGRKAEANDRIARLRNVRPEVVFCLGAKAAWAVKEQLPQTPMVYASILEPERYGISGPQVTGIKTFVPRDVYLSQFVGFFPETKTIGLIRGPGVTDAQLTAFSKATAAYDIALVVENVDSRRATRKAFATLAPQIDALWLFPDREILTPEAFRSLTEETRRRRIPMLVDTENMVRAGGLFAVIPNLEAVGRQAAAMALRILDGAAPAIIDVETPSEVLVVLNTRTLRVIESDLDPLLLDFVDLLVE